MLASFAACRCERPRILTSGDDAAVDASAPKVEPGAPAAVLLLNDEAIEAATWTADGAVIALSRHRFWWFRVDDAGRAQTTVLGGNGLFSHFAAARNIDVSVVTAGGKAHVFRGPKEVYSFALQDENAKTLSNDGTMLVTERMESSSTTGTHFLGALYDVATGKRLSEHASVPVLSPDGAWTMDRESIRATRSGEEVLRLPEPASLLPERSPWFDGGAMAWARSGLVVADPKTRSALTVPARCKDGEIDELIEAVDPTTKQAVRFCGRRVLVVRVEAGTPPVVLEVRVPASRKGSTPSLGFARDDGAPLLLWGLEVDRIDVGARSIVRAAKGIARTTSSAADEEGAPSPDGRYRLHLESILSRTGAVTVRDAAGAEVVHFGVTRPRESKITLAPFVHEHGLDVFEGDGAKPRRVRIGPDAAPLADVPRLLPDGACDGKANETMPMPPQRTLTGGAAIFVWPNGGSCVCVRGGCADPKLPQGVLARHDERLIVSDMSGPGRSEVTFLEQRKGRGAVTLQDELRGAAFLDDETGAALLTERRTSERDTWRVSEVKLPRFEGGGEPVEIEHPLFYGWDYTVLGTKSSIAVFLSDRDVLKGWIIPRGPQEAGKKLTRVDAWDDSAVVTLPDGRMDLYGPAPERALVCADGRGAVTPFATCRARVEARGGFRID